MFNNAIIFSFLIFLISNAHSLPPKVEADRQLQAAAYEMGQDRIAWQRVVEALQAAEATGVKMPESFYFHLGSALNEIGEYESAKKSLTKYLENYGNRGKHYRAALDKFNINEKNISAAASEKSLNKEIDNSWKSRYFYYWILDRSGSGSCYDVEKIIEKQTGNEKAFRKFDCSCSTEAINHPAYKDRTQDVCKGTLEFNTKLTGKSDLVDFTSSSSYGYRFRSSP